MKKDNSKDPAGHIKLAVSNIRKSKEFYSRIFEALRFKKVSDAGWVSQQGFGIWISQAGKEKPKYVFSAPGLHHICIKANSEEEVDEVFDILKAKTHIFDAPQKYPEYTKKYYAVFFADPDGIKIEVAYY